MARLGGFIAGLVLAVLAAAPAAANTIANFALNNVTFDDGAAATGTFSLDVTAHTIRNVAITTTDGSSIIGVSYSGFIFDSYASSTTTQLSFDAPVFFPIAGNILNLNFGLNDATDLTSLPSFAASGDEGVFFVLCGGICQSRTITGGTISTLNFATTPIPAALPLLATALGGMGFVGWRRKRQAVA